MSYRELIQAAEEYLEGREPTPSPQIAAHLRDRMARSEIETHPQGVIFSYLSRAANHDEESRIVSGGPHGGYSLERAAEAAADAPEERVVEKLQPADEPEQFKPLEKHLYPLLQAWLRASEYIAEDVSVLKRGGQWGNPDLLGVSRIEILGTSEIEVVSVEAKLSELSWERFIFEAVSHKRFANRSWYCYRTNTPYPALPKNMAYYAERYKVGIIQIYLTDPELEALSRNDEAGTQQEKALGFLDRVQERVRALYEPVPLQEKKAFLDRANMTLNLNVARQV